MEFMTRCLVVPVVDELPCIQIEDVWPISVLAARIKDDEFLVLPNPGSSESSLISSPLQRLGNWIVTCMTGVPAFIHGVDD
jgi:hypothetical protein